MQDPFKQKYDPKYCAALYAIYDSGDESVLSDLIESLCPLIRLRYIHEEGTTPNQDQYSMEADALGLLLEVLREEDIPTDPSQFNLYMSRVISRSIVSSAIKLRRQDFDLGSVGKSPPHARLETQFDVDMRLYERQLVWNIRESIRSKVRFSGDEAEACKFILDCELEFKNNDPRLAKQKFKISSQRCNYLISYIKILIRAELWEIRLSEREIGSLAHQWETSGGILCPAG